MFGKRPELPVLKVEAPNLPYVPETEHVTAEVKALRDQRYSNANPNFQVQSPSIPNTYGYGHWGGSIDELYLTIQGVSGNTKAYFGRDSDQKLWNYRFDGQPKLSKRWGHPVFHNDDFTRLMVRTKLQALHIEFYLAKPEHQARHREFLEALRIAPQADPSHQGFQIIWPLEPLPHSGPLF